jgi:hypothetical protein
MFALGRIYTNGTANGIGTPTMGVNLHWNVGTEIHYSNFNIGNLNEHRSEIESLFPSVGLFEFSPSDQFANYIPVDSIVNIVTNTP